jgi:hypothetical protein
MSHVLSVTGRAGCTMLLSGAQFDTYESFISGIFHLIFSGGKPRIPNPRMRGVLLYLYLHFSIYVYGFRVKSRLGLLSLMHSYPQHLVVASYGLRCKQFTAVGYI